ncbi:MAG: pyruvate kinase [Defluviitaleaceae bacterium]|nr:pyruvate kinase [Defluviitaleaceae bacterium]
MRKTKIVATLGPATNDIDIVKKLILSGMDTARINFSHGSYESHSATVRLVTQAREELRAPIALMLDTKGPEIRIRTFENESVILEQGNKFTLTTEDIVGNETCVSVDYEDLPNDLKVGYRVLIDDGLIELRVINIHGNEIECIVENNGELGSRKGVNLPDSQVNLPSITEKDIEDIRFGIGMGFDYLAASFVRSAKDVLEIRRILEDNGGSNINILAKIENREGVENIESILEAADGIMVARGDLGVEIPPEEVPFIQKMLIKKANAVGKPVITATHMLESMVNNPRPTRAEANDVANAIYDGSDAVMLSGETAKGNYPVESVQMMDRIARKSEQDFNFEVHTAHLGQNATNVTNAITHATCTTAADLNATCIVNVTKSGFTARMVSKYRPKCPVLAVAHDEHVWRQMNLVWGVKPHLPATPIDAIKESDLFDLATHAALDSGVAKNGDIIVVVAGVPVGVAGSTNLIKAQIVGDILVNGQGISNGGNKIVIGKTSVVKHFEESYRVFQEGDILVATQTDDSMMDNIRKAGAVVVGSDQKQDYTHVKIACRALRKPLLVCNVNVTKLIHTGVTVSIDLESGFVYNGLISD